jgi:hypothetical protein
MTADEEQAELVEAALGDRPIARVGDRLRVNCKALKMLADTDWDEYVVLLSGVRRLDDGTVELVFEVDKPWPTQTSSSQKL